MKIDRRSFLGLGLGAAAGVAVSPVAWKLMDDSSIWTQNWPWTPVPRDGEVTFDNTVCSMCPGNCGLSVKKIDGRPVKIEGRDDYPVNTGGVCLHGVSGLQYLYDPSRIKTPLKRIGDTFEEISWDEALELVATKLAEIRDAGKADSIACVTNHGMGTVPGLFQRLLKALGSNNFLSIDTMDKAWEKTLEKMHGVNGTLGFDLENADFILSFGTGLIEGWGSPVSNFKVNSSRKERGAALIQVEPRLSNTAAAADTWLAANPNTEADLALAMANVIISNNLYNTGYYVSGFGPGFDDLAAMLKENYSPEAVAKTTGIDAAVIVDIAKRFAKSGAPVAIAGKGKGSTPGSAREFAAVHLLNCLAGNINTKGGAWILSPQDYDQWPGVEMDDVASQAIEKPAMDPAGSVAGFFAKAGAEKTVQALLISDANPCYALNDAKAITKAVQEIPFVVSFSSFMDETTQQADVVLPSHTFLERTEDLPSAAGMARRVTGLAKPVTAPVFNTKNPGDAILAIAKAMEGTVGESFPWESYEECLEAVTGDLWSDLSDQGYAAVQEKAPATRPSVDFSFVAQNPASVEAEGTEADFSLILVPLDNVRIATGSIASSPFAVKTVPDTVLAGKDSLVEMNPETAKANKLSQGDLAVLETPKGKATVKVNLFEGIMPGVIGMPRGLGHAMEENRYVSGKGVNINELMGPVMDAASGLDAAWGIRANISKA